MSVNSSFGVNRHWNGCWDFSKGTCGRERNLIEDQCHILSLSKDEAIIYSDFTNEPKLIQINSCTYIQKGGVNPWVKGSMHVLFWNMHSRVERGRKGRERKISKQSTKDNTSSILIAKHTEPFTQGLTPPLYRQPGVMWNCGCLDRSRSVPKVEGFCLLLNAVPKPELGLNHGSNMYAWIWNYIVVNLQNYFKRPIRSSSIDRLEFWV